MTRSKKLGLGALVVAITLIASALWLLGTDSGTRFLLARAQPYLPAELTLGETRGTLLGGVRLATANWKSESVDATVRDAFVDVGLAALFSKHLAIRTLDVEEITIVATATAESDKTLELPSVESPLRVSIDSSSLRNVSFARDQVQRRVDDIQLSGSLTGSKLELSHLSIKSNWLNARVEGAADIAGLYAGRLTADWRWTESPSLQLVGELRVLGDLRGYQIEHKLTAPQQLATTGTVSYVGGEFRFDLSNSWNSFVWDFDEAQLLSPSGSLRLQGDPGNVDISLDTLAQLGDLPQTRIMIEGNTDAETISFSRLSATNDLGELIASGEAGWSPAPVFDVEFSLSDLDPSLVPGLFAGKIDTRGRIHGSFVADAPDITLLISDLGGMVNGQALDGDGAFNYSKQQLTITNSRIQLGANRLRVDGTAGDALALDADLELSAIQDLWPDASGNLSASISLQGSRERPEVRVKAEGDDVLWSEYAIGSLSVDAGLSSGQEIDAEMMLGKLTVRGYEADSARLIAAGTIDKHRLSAELGSKGNSVATAVVGGYANGRWAGVVNALSIGNELAGEWTLQGDAELAVSSEEISLSKACLERKKQSGRACVAAASALDGTVTFDAAINDLPLGVLPTRLPQEVRLSGLGDVQAHGSMIEGRLTGDASVTLRQARVDAVVDDETISAAFTQAAGNVSIVDNRAVSTLHLGLAEGAGETTFDLTVEDILDARSSIAGNGSVEINEMSLFAVLVPDIANPSGRVSANLAMSGSLGQPEFLGALAVTDGAFGVRKAGIQITEFNARLSQASVGHLELKGVARSGDGQISIQGDTWVSTDTGIHSEVLLTGQDFELSRLPNWRISASPSIAIVFDDRTTTVTGNLYIPTTDVRLRELPASAESPSPDAIVHRAEGSSSAVRRRIDVDVAVGLGDDVRFSGFGLSTGIEGAVRVRGGTRLPYTGTGTLSLRDGRYKAYGQELEIERGQLIFNGPLDNPQLDIRAVRKTTEVLAGIVLSGTPTQLRSDVFSEPPLGDAEALSYLLTGRPLASATSTGEVDTLNAAAFALGVSSAGKIVSQVRSGLGLETLAIEGGAEDGRLIAGKRFGSRLLVEYGYGLIDKLGTLLLRYQLTDRIILESRTGTVSNFDVLYSVKKK